ncbi:hypothetical protein CN378_21685 [Bacillus sp. AFS015802]|uniref:hypothetical protein n=1 Tax=Bacillus sp. AFS015802 TaxID=2033486 RepID=UPI000BF32C69|nr:hypothetical protein [Bacillus sp. AFS015802]PFA62241.1 hypothetical protein CN378_21685 [Bacillus sp. AFS015802]
MAFGLTKEELRRWKQRVKNGEIAFLTHYWLDDRFPDARTVTKVGCCDIDELSRWGEKYGLKKEWIHQREDGFPHFDLLGKTQYDILVKEGLHEHIDRFIHK